MVGGEILPREFQEFMLQAQAPDSPGEYTFGATQTYEDGSEVEWTGVPDSEEPASVVTVVEGGTEDHHGGSGAAESATSASAPQTETSHHGGATGDLPQTGGPVSPLLGAAAVVSFLAGLTTAALISRRRRAQ